MRESIGLRSSTLTPVASSSRRSTGLASGSSPNGGRVRVASCMGLESLLSSLFKNDKLGGGGGLGGGILRDNLENVRSSFVERFFHRGLQGEGRRWATAAGTVQLEPDNPIPHTDQLAVP